VESKKKLIFILSVFIFILSLTGCQTIQTTTSQPPSQPSVQMGDSIYLEDGGETSFNLNKNEIQSVVLFLEEDENAYINYTIVPTEFNEVVEVTFTEPDGDTGVYGGAYTGWNMRVGEGSKGYYSINFEYLFPLTLDDVPQEKRAVWTMAPDTFEVYFSCDITKEWR
jgi:hypothetical protein